MTLQKDLEQSKRDLIDLQDDVITMTKHIAYLEDLLWWERFINYCHTGK